MFSRKQTFSTGVALAFVAAKQHRGRCDNVFVGGGVLVYGNKITFQVTQLHRFSISFCRNKLT